MKSSFLPLLLIACLLACPVRCISCEANVVVSEECAPAACSCCSHSDETPGPERLGPERPEPTGDDCDCQNCICEGALLEADLELPEATCQMIGWVQPKSLVTNSVAPPHRLFLRRSSFASGRLLSGRDVRVAHQSWVI